MSNQFLGDEKILTQSGFAINKLSADQWEINDCHYWPKSQEWKIISCIGSRRGFKSMLNFLLKRKPFFDMAIKEKKVIQGDKLLDRLEAIERMCLEILKLLSGASQ